MDCYGRECGKLVLASEEMTHGEIGTTLSYVVDHVFVMHFSKGHDLCIELGLTVTGSLIQHDIVCYLGARLSLTSDYECKAGLGLCCEI
ncbi:unnamed protein product [Arabidopsis thaliana]|uniref:Uncharacterized protein n=1 Tax=Arabidopsis thaliana TaxID=3702 RepID=A0A5S9Y8Q7_ARATH|nr:unnamed protein product [Arabidopsis thaliana]